MRKKLINKIKNNFVSLLIICFLCTVFAIMFASQFHLIDSGTVVRRDTFVIEEARMDVSIFGQDRDNK